MDYWKIRGHLLAWQKICLIFTVVSQTFTSWKHILWPSNIKHNFPDLLWFTEQLESWCSLIWWTILLPNSFYSLKQRKICKGKKILCTDSNFSVQQEHTNITWSSSLDTCVLQRIWLNCWLESTSLLFMSCPAVHIHNSNSLPHDSLCR